MSINKITTILFILLGWLSQTQAQLLPDQMSFYTSISGKGNATITLSPTTPYSDQTECNESNTECSYVYDTATWITITATRTNEDSFFAYWTGNSQCAQRVIEEETSEEQGVTKIFLTSNMTCTARFNLSPFKLAIIYDGNGSGNVSIAPSGTTVDCELDSEEEICQEYDSNSNTITEVTLIPTPDTGSSFTEWSGDEDCSDGLVSMDKSMDCTATFTLLTHSLTVTNIGTGTGSVTTDPANPINLNYGTEVALTATANTNMAFTGWEGDCTGTDTSITVVMDADKNCTATFVPVYNLTLTAVGEGTIDNDLAGDTCGNNCFIYPEGTTINLTAVPNTESGEDLSKFTDWREDCTGTDNPLTFEIAANMDCTANFELLPPPGSHNISTTTTGNGIVEITSESDEFNCGQDCKTYPDGTEVTLTATSNANALFLEWTSDCTGTDNPTTLVMDAEKSCTANFETIPEAGNYNLKWIATGNGQVEITSDPSGTDCGLNCTTHPENTTVTLTAKPETAPESASDFIYWTGDCRGIDLSANTELTTEIVMDSTKTCTANFANLPEAENYNLIILAAGGNGTFKTDPEGTECGINCFSYEKETTVTLTAIPNADSAFINWSEPCTGTTPQTQVVMEANKRCIANFELLPPPRLQFSSPSYVINEVAGSAKFLVSRATSSYGDITVDYEITGITATAELDYEPVSGPLSWPNGDMSHKEIEIPILLDSESENDELLSITLINPTGGALLGQDIQSVLTIIDTPPTGAGSLEFSSTNYAVKENSGTATVSVERIGGSIGAVSVNYLTDDETAIANNDYITTQGILNWADGDAQIQILTVPILDDDQPEEPKTFTLTLANSTGGANVGANRVTTLTILDSLATPETSEFPGILQFTAPNYQVAEEVGSIALTVNRAMGNKGEVSVNYSTQDASAQADSDYIATSGALKWAAGDNESQNIIIPILFDDVEEEAETFTVKLSNPDGEASLGAIPMATVKVVDELSTPGTVGSPGILQFMATNYQIAENGDNITITVTRTEGSEGDIEVTYSIEEDTATSNDYVATEGILQWLDGDIEDKSFEFQVQNDSVIEDTESLILILSEPTGDAQLGSNAEAILTILDDDATKLQVSSNTYVVDEDAEFVTITVSRISGKVSEVSMEYNTLDECQSTTTACATPNEDYTASNGFLIWISGDKRDKTFTIPIHDDREAEGNESFQLQFTDIEGGALLGTSPESTITIVIQDNDPGECQPDPEEPIIDCYWNNEGNTLYDAIITPIGTVVGGQLGGDIQNEGILQDVTLLVDTRLTGNLFECAECGIMRGTISSDSEFPAIISYVKIVADSTLSHIIVGIGSIVDSGVILKPGVRFEYNGLVPYMADLQEILGTISTPGFQRNAIKVTDDVLLNRNRNGILGGINGLYEIAKLNGSIRQNPENGYLVLDIAPIHYTVMPVQVRHVWGRQTVDNKPLTPMGLTLEPNGQVIFVTHTGREVVGLPVIQNPLGLREALIPLGLDEMTMQTNGNLKVLTTGNRYYMARPNLFSVEIPMGSIPLGINGTTTQWQTTDLFFVFEGSSGPNDLQQFMYPAPADSEALQALSETSDSNTTWYNDGRVDAYTGFGDQKLSYKGVLDYLVISGPASNSEIAQISELVEDRNGDGLLDYLIAYPNGDTQVMYQCPDCFGE